MDFENIYRVTIFTFFDAMQEALIFTEYDVHGTFWTVNYQAVFVKCDY